jgi:transposase InsO family protein
MRTTDGTDASPGQFAPQLADQAQLTAKANAVAESFFATLKKELIHRRSWPMREELRREVFEYIEIFYNATRRHSTLDMLSPAGYEERQSLEQLNNPNNN